MNSLNFKAIVLTVAFAFSAGAMAQGISKTEYEGSTERISADYKTAKATCSSLSGNAKDICVAKARGNNKVALAELESSYKPTTKNHYVVRIAKAEADYSVAQQKCDELAGNTKDVCVKEAKAAQTTAKADAKVQMKTSDANAAANEKSSEARKDATVDKLDAEYTVAKEKCNTFAGSTKDTCLDQAKIRFGKS